MESVVLLLIVCLLSVSAIAATVVAVARDGYRARPIDRSRLP